MFGQRFLNTYLEKLNRNVQATGDLGQVQLARAVAAAQLHKDLVKLPSAVTNPGVVKQQLRGPVARKGVPPQSVAPVIDSVQEQGSTRPGRAFTVEEHELPGFSIREPY